MKRPVAVVLTAIVLGLLAALQLLGAITMGIAGVAILYKGMPTPAGPQPFPAWFLPILIFGMALFCLALGVWSVVTLVGLVRLRSWARYSVLVIAGCMAVFSAFGMVISIAITFMMPPVTGGSPAPDPHVMRAIFFAGAAVYAIFTAIGVALLIYFNLAATRALFLQNAPLNLTPPNTSTGRPRPTAITVLSWMFLVCGLCCLPYIFLTIPTFLLGFTLYGWASRIVYLTFTLISIALGYGLLRLRNEARIAVFAWLAFGFVNMLVMVTPWGMHRFTSYMDALNSQMSPAGVSYHSPFLAPGYFIFLAGLGVAFNIFLLWLLQRHREVFTPQPPPPPLPPIAPSFNQAAT